MLRSKKYDWAKGIYTSLLVLVVSVTIGVVFFPRDARNIARSVGETLFLPIISKPLLQSGYTGDIHWEQENAPYPLAYAQVVTVTVGYNDYMYLIGGGDVKLPTDPDEDPLIEQSVRVSFASLHEDGTLGEWQAAQNLPRELYGASATAVNGKIYVLGGLYHSSRELYPEFNNTIYCAKANSEDDLIWEPKSSSWDKFSEWHPGVAFHSTVVVHDRIYLIGGIRQKSAFNESWHPTRFVLSAKLDAGSECQEFDWEVEQIEDDVLPQLMNHTAVGIELGQTEQSGLAKSYIYVMGGEVWAPCADEDECQIRAIIKRLSAAVYRAEIDLEGDSGKSVGPWEHVGDFDTGDGLQLMTAVRTGDYIYVLGGTKYRDPNDNTTTGCIYRTKLLDNGEIGSWDQLNSEGCELTLYGHAATVSRYGRIYVIGGAQVEEGKDIPEVSDTIYWTPLAFLSKYSNPNGAVYSGDRIIYNLTAASNNVRDLYDLEIIDMLPANLQLVSAPRFTYDAPILTSENFDLPINHMAQFAFKAEVLPDLPVETVTSNSRFPITTHEPNPQITSTPAIAIQSVDSNIRPTQVKGCGTGDDVISSGTPRPKTTCTPTPVITLTATLTGTPTPTSTDTPTSTPTPTVGTPTVVPTPTEPVYVVNEAFLCFGLEQHWCKMATAINAPFQIYLPLVTK